MRGLLIDVKNSKVEAVEREDDFELQDYYDMLDCDYIDIVCRKIGERYYDIVCDDEGLLKAGCKVSAVDSEYCTMLVGNLFIRGLARDGEMTNLTIPDINYIAKKIRFVSTAEYPEGYWILTQLDY